MKLRAKILTMCLGCTFLALILQTAVFYRLSSGFVYDQSKNESESSLKNMQNEINQYVKRIESSLVDIYVEEDFIQALKEKQDIEELRNRFFRRAYDIGTSNFETQDGVVALYLYTPENEIVSTYRRAVTPKHRYAEDIYSDMEQENADIVLKYLKSDDTTMLISSYYNPYREKDILRFVLKLYNNSNRYQKIGYVVCDVDSKVFTAIMEKYRTDSTMFIWLQPDGDRPVTALGTLSSEEEKMYKDMSAQIGSSDSVSMDENKEQVIFRAEQSKYNLTAYSILPQSILWRNQKNLSINVILIGVFMIVLTTVLTFLISRSMIRPLGSLMCTIQRIKHGETNLRADTKNKDEIGELGRNFNEMLDQMEELKEKESKARLLQSQAEYKALQAQINPHFLYNTLETMSSIAEIRGCPEVSMLSQSLSNIFRYSLNMKEQLSTAAQEINHLKNYCYVMSVRMQDNIEYIYDIDETVLQEKIPRISIQPLVENALNHGLRNKRGKKRVWIGIKRAEEKLEISVRDNGMGMDAGKINEILQKNEQPQTEKGSSIGLYNINARVKMLYGDEYGIRIESVPNEGTCVYIIMPAGKEGGEKGGKEQDV